MISRTFQFPGLLLDQKELEELERYSRNANHHDHGHHHEHGHEASEDIFDRAARVGIRVFDGKDREGADDLGNDLELIGGMIQYDEIKYRKVASKSSCYYSGNQKFCIIKVSILLACRTFLGTNFL